MNFEHLKLGHTVLKDPNTAKFRTNYMEMILIMITVLQ